MDHEKHKNLAQEIRNWLAMVMRAVDEASDTATIFRAAISEVVPGYQGAYLKKYKVAKTNSMALPMNKALVQAGMLDRMIRVLESLREGKK